MSSTVSKKQIHKSSGDSTTTTVDIKKEQSPIPLFFNRATPAQLDPFNFDCLDLPLKASITNNGRTVKLTVTDSSIPMVTGGGLPEPYQLENVHFHWEAEHTLENVRHVLETHMIFYSTKYKSALQAMENNGIANFATIFTLGEPINPAIDVIAEMVPGIKGVINQPVNLNRRIVLQHLMSPDRNMFFRYKGSLTTTPYSESVIMTVFVQRQTLQLEQLRRLKDICTEFGCPIQGNYRKLQPTGRPYFIVKCNVICDTNFADTFKS